MKLLWVGAEIQESYKSDCLIEWFTYILELVCSNLAQFEMENWTCSIPKF